jgi:hypothetical protein
MRHSPCSWSRRTALALVLLAALRASGPAAAAQVPGIVDGPGMRLAGTHTFAFIASAAGGTVSWSVDRETISDTGTSTRTSGFASGTGTTRAFSLPAVSGSETIYYITAADRGVLDVDTVQVFPAGTRTWFTYRSAGNPDVRVYAAIPASLSPASRILVVMHGNNRTADEFCDIWRSWATQHDYVLLCPYYDLVHWPNTGMYQMGNVFSADDCGGTMNPESRWTFTIDLGIHQRAREGFGIVDARFDLWGFSGGGQHVHRFMLFEPHAPVRLAIAAASGWYTAPDLSTDCPYGVDDPLLSLAHQDVVDWTNRNMILAVGTADTVRDDELRTTARADAQGLNRYQRADYMRNTAVGFNPLTRWRRVDVPGAAHEAKLVAQGTRDFLLQGLPLDSTSPGRVGARPVVRVHPNPLAGTATLSGEGWRDGEVTIEVFDLAGRKIAWRAASAITGQWRCAWSSLATHGAIAPGMYLVRVRDRERQAQQRVLVLGGR